MSAHTSPLNPLVTPHIDSILRNGHNLGGPNIQIRSEGHAMRQAPHRVSIGNFGDVHTPISAYGPPRSGGLISTGDEVEELRSSFKNAR